MGRIDGDRQLLVELVQVFRDGLPAMLAELDAALAAGDAARVAPRRPRAERRPAEPERPSRPRPWPGTSTTPPAGASCGQAPGRLARLRQELQRLEQALGKEAVEVAA